MKKKNLLISFGVALMALSLTSCAIIYHVIDDKVNDGDGSSANFDGEKTDVDGKTIINQNYKDYSNNNIYPVDYCPSEGNIKLLIIPVWLSDSSDYITSAKKSQVINDINHAYLGTNSQTGWRSVKTYYEELSNGSLTITGTVTDWYSVSYSSTQVGYNANITEELVTSGTNWYFNNNPTDDRSNYDSDNNGYIDAVMLIYGAPDCSALKNDNLENLWAYCYWLQEKNTTSKAIPNAFFWASYDFMYSSGSSFSPTPAGTKYGSGDTSHCIIDAHTYIHEMGHILGLEDYYDYAKTKYSPAGGFSMQDYNVGCHDPYSAMALGWANPYVVTSDSVVNIGTFQKTRDLVVLTSEWNEYNSPFDEYLIFELFSPTGLNELDCRYSYASSIKGPNTVGVRLWHIDARLAYSTSTKTVKENGQTQEVPVYSDSKITTNAKDKRATYGVIHAFSNTYNDADYGSELGKDYYNYNILQLIRKDRTLSYSELKNNISYSDLFGSGTYDLTTYKKQFVKGSSNQMNNGTS